MIVHVCARLCIVLRCCVIEFALCLAVVLKSYSVYVCVYVCVCVCECVYVYVCVCVCMYVCMCVC